MTYEGKPNAETPDGLRRIAERVRRLSREIDERDSDAVARLADLAKELEARAARLEGSSVGT